MNETPFNGARYFAGTDDSIGVILFHAYTGSPNDVNALGRLLNRQGYGVLMPLFKGHGTRDVRELVAVDPHEWTDQARQAVAWMRERYTTVYAFGLSLGGVIATWSLLHCPELTAGGMFNSPVIRAQRFDITASFEAYVEALYGRNGMADRYAGDLPSILTDYHQQMARLDALKGEFEGCLSSLARPYYIAQSGADQLVNPQDVYHLLALLYQQRLEFYQFPANTHVITVDRERQPFEASVLSFIQRHSS